MRKPYDLILLLDPEAPEERRAEILSETEAMIAGGGEVTTKQDWGQRRMTFEIDHRPEAAYHLFQFEGEPPVLERLRSTLRIADGVLRFRIIKVKPGTPPPTAPRPEARREEQEEPEGKVAARAAADAPDPEPEATADTAPAEAPATEAAAEAAPAPPEAPAPPAEPDGPAESEAPAEPEAAAAAPEGESA
ncbi:MAG: 30S ribosomal protein S6 [Thermoleophilaceae bacterium]